MKRIVFLILVLISLNSYAPELSKENKEARELNRENQRELERLMTAEFSEDNLRNLLILLNVDHVEIIINQAKIESGWYKSPLFKNHNSLFGMHYPLIRDSYAYEYTIADNGRKCASYRSWQSSVLDFILRIEYYKNLGFPTKDYYLFLEETNYCEKDIYIDLLKSMA